MATVLFRRLPRQPLGGAESKPKQEAGLAA